MSRHAQSFKTSRTRRHLARLALGIAVLAPIALTSAVVAAPPDLGLGASARLVSDEELGDMRGRYIETENVNFFGIAAASSFQTADGLVLTATLQFEADFNNGQPLAPPVILASYQHDQNGIDDPGLEIGGITAEFRPTRSVAMTTTLPTCSASGSVISMRTPPGSPTMAPP
jgi:hypothetical protein